jgi:serine/threonine-protein kinase
MVFGTPQYMSPEQAQGLPVDARSDVYSVGILFYEMLLGVVPFDSESSLEILNGHVSGRVIPPKSRDPAVRVDDATNNTIMRCLQKRPEDRFQSMDELRMSLRECFTDRVYLRDAHLLPGAVESGVVPLAEPRTAPPVPVGPPPVPPREARRSAPSASGGAPRKKRLSEDLAELFSSGKAPVGDDAKVAEGGVPAAAPRKAPSAAADQARAVEREPAATPDRTHTTGPQARLRGAPPTSEPEEPTREMPQGERSRTHQGLGAVRGSSTPGNPASSRASQKRPTAPLAQRNKEPSR